jgi:hypothetical protein
MEQQVRLPKIILQIFGNMSGLTVYLQKSELLGTQMNHARVVQLEDEINCKAGEFSIKYLGLQLSDRALKKDDYRYMIDKIQNQLPGWQASKLSITGRKILTNAVLSTTPIYFIASILLSKWEIKTVNKIRRRFL